MFFTTKGNWSIIKKQNTQENTKYVEDNMASLSERSEIKRYEQNKKRKKIVRLGALFTIVIAVVAGILFYVLFQMNRTYGGYSVINEVKRKDGVGVQYEMHGDTVLKYSKDGASGLDSTGEILWNGSYEFKNPYADTCGDYVAIADIGEKSICIFNGSGTGSKFSVDGAIEQISIANQGVVAAVLENDDEAKIDIYDPYSATEKLKVSISTSTDSDGYPVAIALSEDGQKLVTSYINITNGVVSSSLNFYNFDSVGKNSVDRIVGSRPLEQEIVADVQFINSEIVCAFTKTGFKLYRMKETPSDIAQISVEENIKSVCYNEEYITLVLDNNTNTDQSHLVQVYNTNGKLVLEKTVSYAYDTVEMGEEEVIFYSSSECHILRLRGSEKLDCTFDENVSYFFPLSSSEKYILIDSDTINQIRLTGRKEGE